MKSLKVLTLRYEAHSQPSKLFTSSRSSLSLPGLAAGDAILARNFRRVVTLRYERDLCIYRKGTTEGRCPWQSGML